MKQQNVDKYLKEFIEDSQYDYTDLSDLLKQFESNFDINEFEKAFDKINIQAIIADYIEIFTSSEPNDALIMYEIEYFDNWDRLITKYLDGHCYSIRNITYAIMMEVFKLSNAAELLKQDMISKLQ